jgi:hypothetical protein
MSKRATTRKRPFKKKRTVSSRIRAGMPSQDSIKEVVPLAAGAKVYRILRTTERDAYDAPPNRAPQQDKKKRTKKQ